MRLCAMRPVRGILAAALCLAALAAGCSSGKDSMTGPGSSGGGGFASGTLAPGAMFAFTFSDSGAFGYHCGLHPSIMKGAKVIVSDTASANAASVQIVSLSTPGFSPATVAVKPGGTVTWTNAHGMNHSVVND